MMIYATRIILFRKTVLNVKATGTCRSLSLSLFLSKKNYDQQIVEQQTIFLKRGVCVCVCSVSILASHPAAPGLNPSVTKKFSEDKLSMLPRLFNGAG